jgi:hypothetical protein
LEKTMTENLAALTAMIGGHMGDLLSRAPLEPSEDFFEAGGDSLQAVELHSRLVEARAITDEVSAEQLRADLLLMIFDDATPRALGSVLGAYPSAMAANA